VMQRLNFNVDEVSMDRPDKSKPKGRTIKVGEQRMIKLGAKGDKKKNQRCQTCGIADGHNSRTCLSLEENRAKLANHVNCKRGCPPGSKNNKTATALAWNETSTSKKHHVDMNDTKDYVGER
jgi:hypothetical protein